jgi:cytochrome P450
VNIRPKPRILPSTGATTGVLEALAFFRDPGFAQSRFARFGDVFETSLLGQPLVFIRGGEAIGDLLAAGDGVEGWWPESVKQLLGSRSLANRNGPAHRARRRAVGQLFSAAALQRYSPRIVALVNDLAAELITAPGPVPLAKRMRRFAFAVIATVVLGLEGDDRDALFVDFEIWTRALFSIPLRLPGSPFARAMAARQRLLTRLQRLLKAPPQGRGGLDLLAGGLDERGVPLSDDDLVEQLLLLLFAGYETTASSLSCLMRALLLQPEVEGWLRDELQALPWPPAAEAAASTYDPREAPRLDALVQEVLRLTPPVGGFFRRTTQPISLAGVAVPAGRVVQVALAASNRYAPGQAGKDGLEADDLEAGDLEGVDLEGGDLETFRPQRHLEGGCGATLLPFGGGERVCLGKALAELEIRLMVVGLLHQVHLGLAPGQNLELQLLPSPTPRDGLLVTATAPPVSA